MDIWLPVSQIGVGVGSFEMLDTQNGELAVGILFLSCSEAEKFYLAVKYTTFRQKNSRAQWI